MAQIAALAGSLGAGGGQRGGPEPQTAQSDHAADLVAALRPFLSKERAEKLDAAFQAARLAGIAGAMMGL